MVSDPNSSTRSLLLGIWACLSRRRRLQLGMMLMLMLVSGVAELLSLGAVLPFMAVLSDPQRLWQSPIVQEVSIKFGLTSANQLLLPVTLMFALAAILAAFVRLSSLWLNGRIAAAVGSDLSCEAYKRTLYQSYGVHVQLNSATIINGITTQLGRTVAGLNALLQLTTSAVVASSLFVGMLLIDWIVALAAAAIFSSAYCLLVITARKELFSNSQKISVASRQQLKSLQEGLGAIRDVILDSSQQAYLDTYRKVDRPQRQFIARNSFLGAFPRYAIEALGLVLFSLLGYLLMQQRGNTSDILPLMGAMALGAQRLLPSLQGVYSGWAFLKGSNAAIKAVLTLLDQPLPSLARKASKSISFCNCIRLEAVRFLYRQDQSEVLKGLDLEIRRGEHIGFIGSTGSGKSTTVDLLMGLLVPTQGRVLVDGADLHDPSCPERLLAWRASIAHVPQNIYLADSSIAENIAFGVPRQNIDLELVKKSAFQAQIAGFIESNPEGYESFVGERGIRLSGGQRQRLGIARALYKKAQVLVLDEATSALDTSTEKTVMKSINTLSESLTVIMIAHRLSTVESCDRVIRLEQGVVSADGPPREVLASQS